MIRELCLTLLLLASAASAVAAPAPQEAVAHPVRPRRDAASDPQGWARFFQQEADRLFREGRLNTNLVAHAQNTGCVLKLPPVPTRVLEPADLAKRIEMGVVCVGRMVRVDKTNLLADAASGFLISDSGAVVTCRHLLKLKGLVIVGLAVMTRDGQVCPVRQVLAADPLNDLVILQVEGRDFTALPVRAGARQGEPVWVLSHPTEGLLAASLPYTLTAGIVSGYQARFWESDATGLLGPQTERILMNITADFANGSSGAPVCDARGAVVGIAAITQGIHDDQGTGVGPCPLMVVRGCTPSAALLNLIRPQ